MEATSFKKEKKVEEIWLHNEREPDFNEIDSFSDGSSPGISQSNICDNATNKSIQRKSANLEKLKQLSVIKLKPISIASDTSVLKNTLNLRQSFKFSSFLKNSKQMSTQTSQINLSQNRLIIADERITNQSRHNMLRPSSLPPENVALTHLVKRVQADAKRNHLLIGDGDKKVFEKTEKMYEHELLKPDLELADFIPPLPVQCVTIKPKSRRKMTPKLNVNMIYRPQTKKRRPVSKHHPSNTSTESSLNTDSSKKPYLKRKTQSIQLKPKKRENLSNYETKSDLSNDSFVNAGGNNLAKLTAVVENLQNFDWEVNIKGLHFFALLASAVDWETETGQKFIPIISRKLIEFIKSPRSNLCRTACQTAGEFFTTAKNTKRPEFDEMVDILLCKTSDPNRFIQKDASAALHKMAVSICVHQSVRAVCAKGPDHKNCIVRASTAYLLYYICKNAGIEQIIGCDANCRTRKRVLTNLGKFLIDKNLETRNNAEKLCKLLKVHKLFNEYFFKDVDNNFKVPLRKLLNSKRFD